MVKNLRYKGTNEYSDLLSGLVSSSEIVPIYSEANMPRFEMGSEKGQNITSISEDINNSTSARGITSFERNTLDYFAQNDEIRRGKLIEEAVSKLMKVMRWYDYSKDSENMIWEVVDDISTSSLAILGAALQRIVINYYDKENILCGVAKCLCGFDLDQTAEWGPIILLSLLNNRSDIVKENAVLLIENWQNISMLPMLKCLDCHATWLRDYIACVVSDLEAACIT